MKKSTKEEFINRSIEIHDGRYDYSKVDYINSRTKVVIICKRHGEFLQTPHNHLQGQGCPRCKYEVGKVKLYGFGINDIGNNCLHEYFYNCWHNMIKRCYGEYGKKGSYKGVNVCEEWRFLSNFKEWFDANYVENFCLDKDILSGDEKIYSPKTCCFIPEDINAIITEREFDKKLPKWVRQRGKRFRSIYTIGGKKYYKTFDTPQEAYMDAVKAKKKHVIAMAIRYKNVIEPRVFNALLNYEVK